MLNGGSPFSRHIVLLPDEAIISPSPLDSEKLYPSLYLFSSFLILSSLFPLLLSASFCFFCSFFFPWLFGMCNNADMWLPVINAAVTGNWMGDCGNCASFPLEKLRLLFQLFARLCTVAVLVIISRVPSTCLRFCFPGADRGDCFQGAARLHRRR